MENDSTAISNITNVSQGYNSGNYLIYAVLFQAVRLIVGTFLDKWYWQLDFGSKLTIVSLLYLTVALYTF
jgi:hypothetical protein